MNANEIEITALFGDEITFTPFDMSNNRATLGDDAGEITWNNAKSCATEFAPLNDDDKREAFRGFVRGFGAWDDEEIAGWDDQELNALFLQFVSGDIREAFGDADPQDWDWEAYEADDSLAHRLFRADDGRIYFHVEN